MHTAQRMVDDVQPEEKNGKGKAEPVEKAGPTSAPEGSGLFFSSTLMHVSNHSDWRKQGRSQGQDPTNGARYYSLPASLVTPFVLTGHLRDRILKSIPIKSPLIFGRLKC
ncbi:hypothetical protein N7G274_005388 [Stereocaulon virgatum]|uniref:Uncharacterized protein n=1 Tax=Stereocaulon virgatum TaxID=373712 RepID=A0ABR4A7X4_9LECA